LLVKPQNRSRPPRFRAHSSAIPSASHFIPPRIRPMPCLYLTHSTSNSIPPVCYFFGRGSPCRIPRNPCQKSSSPPIGLRQPLHRHVPAARRQWRCHHHASPEPRLRPRRRLPPHDHLALPRSSMSANIAAPSRISTASRPSGMSCRTNPFRKPNPKQTQPLATLYPRTHFRRAQSLSSPVPQVL